MDYQRIGTLRRRLPPKKTLTPLEEVQAIHGILTNPEIRDLSNELRRELREWMVQLLSDLGNRGATAEYLAALKSQLRASQKDEARLLAQIHQLEQKLGI